ncbi:MAG: hypothetical protein GY745_07345 [Actinomycetia bacterium]|nr:hypothetical protein [Actinomycetes bacterium]
MPAFIEDYAAHLRGLGITVSEFDTNCGHALGCLTREVGDELISIAFD